MPICVHCTTPTKALYVTFGPSHLLCTRCKACKAFADPYVEHEAIIVAIDLILVKPQAYRHLLFNRPSLQQNDVESREKEHRSRSAHRTAKHWLSLLRYFLALLLVDSYLRWFYLCAENRQTGYGVADQGSLLLSYVRILRSTFAVMLSLHLVVSALSLAYQRLLVQISHQRWLHAHRHDVEQFQLHLVSTTLLLSNLAPTFLLGLLLLWQQQPQTASGEDHAPSSMSDSGWQWNEASIDWVIRTLVSGLSAGVALGVVLPLQRTKVGAVMATVILLAGWFVQFQVSQYLQLPFHSGVGVLQTEAGRIGSARYCVA